MTILSDSEILGLIEANNIDSRSGLLIDPFVKENVQSASIDLRLSNDFLTINKNEITCIDMETEIEYIRHIEDEFILHPNTFVLASTMEFVGLPANISGMVMGRSSIGRMGLFVENASWIDPGFNGKITLELYNANSIPIKLKLGKRVCQLILFQMIFGSNNPYDGKYQNSKKTVGSKIYKDKEN